MSRTLAILLAVTWLMATAKTSLADVDLWPLLEVTDESTTVLYPFYVHEGKFLMIFPFFYRTNEGQDYHFIWPLAKVSKGRLARVMPIWFSEREGDFTLLPLFRWTPEEIFWPAPPAYLRRDGSFRLVPPIYLKKGDLELVPPIFFRMREEGKLTRLGAWPLIDYRVFPDRKVLSWLWFVRGEWGEKLFKFRLWPLISLKRDEAAWGLWLVPLFFEHSPKQSDITLFPIFARWSGEKGHGIWLVPFLHAGSSEGFKTWLFGLFDVRRRTSEEKGEIRKSVTVLGLGPLSLYRHQSVTSLEGKPLERKGRFLIFSEELKRSGKRSFGILGIPITSQIPQ
jgi:hypothetical protein